MNVLKFGGTSVANAQNINLVLEIVNETSKKSKLAVVVSAFSGVTDMLVLAASNAAAKDKNYKEINIRIAFNPLEEKFDVLNKAYEKSPEWIDNINPIVNDEISISKAIRKYCQDNPDANEDLVEERIENLKRIKTKQVGIIELDASLDIDTVTEIFIRINQKGVVLSNADFVMSKIASDEQHGGNKMRKMVDYFCR